MSGVLEPAGTSPRPGMYKRGSPVRMPPTMFMFYFKEPLDTNTLFVCFFPSFLGGMEGVIDHREVISAQERANKPHLFDQVLSSTYVSQRCLWKYTPCLRG